MKIKLGIIFGGDSVEHEISIITAIQAMEHINQEKYEIIPIYISKDRTWYTGKMLMDIDVYKDFESLKKYAKKITLVKTKEGFVLQKVDGFLRKNVADVDIVFPMVHGKGVEDGSLAGYLETIGLPFVGPDTLGASLGQDKVVMKQVMEQENIPVPKYTWFYDTEYLMDEKDILKNVEKIGYPVVIKPAKLGSSIGIHVAKTEEEAKTYISEAISYDNKIVIEKCVDNLIEVNCSVIGNYEYQQASILDEIISKNDILTYEDKYLNGSKGKIVGKMSATDRVIPARISEDLTKRVTTLAIQTFKVLGLSGIARIDFLIDSKTNEIYVNEPNTIPGSLSFYLWEPTGKSYETLLDDAITLAIKDYKNKSKKISSFETNVLSNYGGLKGFKNKIK